MKGNNMARNIKQSEFKFGLEVEVVDRISGYKGKITARTEWLFGCRRYSVQSKKLNKDGKPIDAIGCDEMALKLVKAAPGGVKIQSTGGPHDEPTRAPAASRR